MKGTLTVYIRLIDYSANALTTDGTLVPNIAAVTNSIDPANTQFIKVAGYAADVEQTLNIGSQSTGAGAGKIIFNPFTITKSIDAVSPSLFTRTASGTPFRTVEVFFADKKNNLQIKHTYKLVAVKTIGWAIPSEQPGVMENISFEYGGLVISLYHQNEDGTVTVLQHGWNRVKNVSDNDPDLAIN